MEPADPETLTHYYSSHAEPYEQMWAQALLPASIQLVERLPMAGARRVLDLGAGVGALLPTLTARAPGALVVAADRSPGMLRRATPASPRLLADACELPIADAAFDVVVMAFMLFHVPRPDRALAAVRRALRPGGTLGVTTWGRQTDVPAVAAWNEELDAAGVAPADPMPALHDRIDTTDKLRGLLAGAGFDPVSVGLVAWADHPDPAAFFRRHAAMGMTGRRLATISDPALRAQVLERIRARLAVLGPDDFRDDSEVLAAVGTARSMTP
jgi:SAM-dependent methyltransferase